MADDIKNPEPLLVIKPPAGDMEEKNKTQKSISKAAGDMEEKEKTQKAIRKAGDMEEKEKTQKAITKAEGDMEEMKKTQKPITKAAGDMEEKKKTRKAIRTAATTTVLLSAAGIMEYLSVGLRSNTYTEYLSLIALFAIFSFGSAMLFLSFVFP